MAIWPGPAGALPSERVRTVNDGSSVQLTPIPGAPPVPSTSPSLPMIWTPSTDTSPIAERTPSMRRTVSTVLAGRVAVLTVPVKPASNSVLGETVTSALTDSKRSRKVLPMVSVNAKEPATKETPRITATSESRRRSLCDSTLRSVAFSTSGAFLVPGAGLGADGADGAVSAARSRARERHLVGMRVDGGPGGVELLHPLED